MSDVASAKSSPLSSTTTTPLAGSASAPATSIVGAPSLLASFVGPASSPVSTTSSATSSPRPPNASPAVGSSTSTSASASAMSSPRVGSLMVTLQVTDENDDFIPLIFKPDQPNAAGINLTTASPKLFLSCPFGQINLMTPEVMRKVVMWYQKAVPGAVINTSAFGMSSPRDAVGPLPSLGTGLAAGWGTGWPSIQHDLKADASPPANSGSVISPPKNVPRLPLNRSGVGLFDAPHESHSSIDADPAALAATDALLATPKPPAVSRVAGTPLKSRELPAAIGNHRNALMSSAGSASHSITAAWASPLTDAWITTNRHDKDKDTDNDKDKESREAAAAKDRHKPKDTEKASTEPSKGKTDKEKDRSLKGEHKTEEDANADPNRHLYLSVCPAQLKCEDPACVRVHGEWDPRQAEYFQRRNRHTHTGMILCLFHLNGYCDHYKDGHCPYRHFVKVQALTPAQKSEYAFQIKARSRYDHEVARHTPPIIVPWPLSESVRTSSGSVGGTSVSSGSGAGSPASDTSVNSNGSVDPATKWAPEPEDITAHAATGATSALSASAVSSSSAPGSAPSTSTALRSTPLNSPGLTSAPGGAAVPSVVLPPVPKHAWKDLAKSPRPDSLSAVQKEQEEEERRAAHGKPSPRPQLGSAPTSAKPSPRTGPGSTPASAKPSPRPTVPPIGGVPKSSPRPPLDLSALSKPSPRTNTSDEAASGKLSSRTHSSKPGDSKAPAPSGGMGVDTRASPRGPPSVNGSKPLDPKSSPRTGLDAGKPSPRTESGAAKASPRTGADAVEIVKRKFPAHKRGLIASERKAQAWGYEEPIATIINLLVHSPNRCLPISGVGGQLQLWGIVWREEYAEKEGSFTEYVWGILAKLTDLFVCDPKAQTISVKYVVPKTLVRDRKVKDEPATAAAPSTSGAAAAAEGLTSPRGARSEGPRSDGPRSDRKDAEAGSEPDAPTLITANGHGPRRNGVTQIERRAQSWGYEEPLATVINILLNLPTRQAAVSKIGSLLQDWGIRWRQQYSAKIGSWNSFIDKLPRDMFQISRRPVTKGHGDGGSNAVDVKLIRWGPKDNLQPFPEPDPAATPTVVTDSGSAGATPTKLTPRTGNPSVTPTKSDPSAMSSVPVATVSLTGLPNSAHGSSTVSPRTAITSPNSAPPGSSSVISPASAGAAVSPASAPPGTVTAGPSAAPTPKKFEQKKLEKKKPMVPVGSALFGSGHGGSGVTNNIPGSNAISPPGTTNIGPSNQTPPKYPVKKPVPLMHLMSGATLGSQSTPASPPGHSTGPFGGSLSVKTSPSFGPAPSPPSLSPPVSPPVSAALQSGVNPNPPFTRPMLPLILHPHMQHHSQPPPSGPLPVKSHLHSTHSPNKPMLQPHPHISPRGVMSSGTQRSPRSATGLVPHGQPSPRSAAGVVPSASQPSPRSATGLPPFAFASGQPSPRLQVTLPLGMSVGSQPSPRSASSISSQPMPSTTNGPNPSPPPIHPLSLPVSPPQSLGQSAASASASASAAAPASHALASPASIGFTSQSLLVCPMNMDCTLLELNACEAIHGVFEPVQEQEKQRNATGIKKIDLDRLQYACPFYLDPKAYGPCPFGIHCLYRHVNPSHPLSTTHRVAMGALVLAKQTAAMKKLSPR